MMKIFLLLICLALPIAAVQGAWYDNAGWYDQSYQYRLPVEVSAMSAGLQVLDIKSDTIVNAINAIEQLHYSKKCFDYNRILLVEYDAAGMAIDAVDSAGFYLSIDSTEMVNNGGFENVSGSLPTGWTSNMPSSFSVVNGVSHNGSKALKIQSSSVTLHSLTQGPLSMTGGHYYLLAFWVIATQNSYNPSIYFTTTASSSGAPRPMSYLPYLFSKNWSKYEAIVYEPDSINLLLNIYKSITGEAYMDDVSVKRARIDLCVQVDAPGVKRYMLYYQPSEAQETFIPEKRLSSAPITTLSPSFIGSASRYDDITNYSLVSDASYDIWFAETTKKITPTLPAPSQSRGGISISSAKHERQSFQVIFNAKDALTLSAASLSALSTGNDTISAENNYLIIIDYASMSRKSNYAHDFVSRVADLMIPFSAQSLTSSSGNIVLWFTIIVDAGTPAGLYQGNVTISGNKGGTPFTETIPIQLRVHQFELPLYSLFRTSHGGSTFDFPTGGNGVSAYHGVSLPSDRDKLVRDYYAEMCKNKVFPYSVASKGWFFNWNPPPYGYNNNVPGNYFYLYDWDFSSLNSELTYYANNNWKNSIRIGHTNGAVCNRVNLPGITVAWAESGTGITEITQAQYDKLIKDYWSEVAFNLMMQGWIEYAFIEVDETLPDSYWKLQHFAEVMKSDPLTSMITIEHDIDKTGVYTWRQNPETETEPTLKGLLDIWTPANGDGSNYYHDYYFSEAGMDPKTQPHWLYYVHSASLIIDSHGLNNRVLPMRSYSMDSTGYLCWASFIYEYPEAELGNPRVDPYSWYGNGALAYFYPPSTTIPSSPDFTITPSARLEMFREGIDDYEYMKLLEDWMDTAANAGIDTSTGKALKEDMLRMFNHPVQWSVNDEHYLKLRNNVANEIDLLMWSSTYGAPSIAIDEIVRDGDTVRVRLMGTSLYRYTLLRSPDLMTPDWQPVNSLLVEIDGQIELTDSISGGDSVAFYKVQAEIP